MANRAFILIEPGAVALIDKAAMQSGIEGRALMRKAGLSVTAACLRNWPGARRFVVLCGPGNNGGDGYVAALGLLDSGAEVVVYSLGGQAPTAPDAAFFANQWPLPLSDLADYEPRSGDVVVDAVFGAGLGRDVPAVLADMIARVAAASVPVLAVDIPSGIDGHSGSVRGAAFRADRTITFMARKTGMMLLPGKDHCGTVEVVDIGIPMRMLEAHRSTVRILESSLFAPFLRPKATGSNKFSHGHLIVFSGGPNATGAARLAAEAGLRGGAGLVSVAARPESLGVLANHLTAVMLRPLDNADAVIAIADDKRITAAIIGPGFGIGRDLVDIVHGLAGKALVLDADAITTFRDQPDDLFAFIAEKAVPTVLTPHDGEFARLFPDLAADASLSKVDRALAAARRSHAVVISKGADTVVASPDGRVAINDGAPPWLATAGSGDVLAGLVGACLANGLPAFEAALAGVWMHSAAGQAAGEGMTAETLINHIHQPIRAT